MAYGVSVATANRASYPPSPVTAEPSTFTSTVTDFPAGAFTALGLHYLVDWIANGKTPPHAPPIEVDQNTANDGSFWKPGFSRELLCGIPATS